MRRRSPIRRHLPHLMRSSALSRRRRVSSSALPPIAQGCVSKRLTGTPCARAAGARSSGATSAQAAAEAIVPVVRLIAGVMDNSGSRPSLSRAGWPPDISGSRTILGVSLRRSYHKHRIVICIGGEALSRPAGARPVWPARIAFAGRRSRRARCVTGAGPGPRPTLSLSCALEAAAPAAHRWTGVQRLSRDVARWLGLREDVTILEGQTPSCSCAPSVSS